MSAFNEYLPELIEVTLSTDTAIYANNDVLAEFQEVPGVFRVGPGIKTSTINALVLIDEDDQGQAMDIMVSRTGGSLGTENSAVSITDANLRECQRVCNIATADYVDTINNQVANKYALNVPVSSADSATSLYIGAIVRSGTPTYTASGLKLRLYITRH